MTNLWSTLDVKVVGKQWSVEALAEAFTYMSSGAALDVRDRALDDLLRNSMIGAIAIVLNTRRVERIRD